MNYGLYYYFTGSLFVFISINCGERRVSHRRSPTSTRSDSCETSATQQNVTLRGGFKAGYFHKLAQYVAMQLCVQLCCQEKGCDVAFMIASNCYGVKCFSNYLCSIVEAKNAPHTMMMSKVNFRGEAYQKRFMPQRLRCFQTSIEHNVTLKSGLLAGNFTAVGHVEDIDSCAKLCCVREDCNVALMVNNHCFMVRCVDKTGCESAPVINVQFHTHIARVSKIRVIAREQHIVRALGTSATKASNLFCKNDAVQYNHTLLGGYEAGDFHLLSSSSNMTTCIRLCCGEITCDVAFMIEKKCYAVHCINEKLCQAVPAKNSTTLKNLSPRISYMTSRKEEVTSEIVQNRQHEICKSNIISYDVTLRGGVHAGKYKVFGAVNDMRKCIRECCKERHCDLAFMINGTCFTIQCHSEYSCEEIRYVGRSKFKPMIAYVVKEKLNETLQETKKKDDEKGSERRNTSLILEQPSVPSSSLPSVDNEQYCTNSEIMYNVTLRGGITSGVFKDRGILPSMPECLRVCCIATSCDLAFMLGDHCFSVTCKNQILCEVISARSTQYNPRIAYIYARIDMRNQPSHSVQPFGSQISSNKTRHYHNWSINEQRRKKGLKKQWKSSNHHFMRNKKVHRKKQLFYSNEEKLKKMYAEEKLLLRKLSLLKLRMEMIKNAKHNNNIQDRVLYEAFKDEPATGFS